MKTGLLLSLIVAFLQTAPAQEFSISRMPDSLTFRNLVFPEPGQQLLHPEILVPVDFSDSSVINNLPPGFLRSALLYQPIALEKSNPISSMYLHWSFDNPWKPLLTALGYIQAGGAAYLTYKALKKYGYIR